VPEYVLGIDLGTTNSCMAVMRPASSGEYRAEVLYNAMGQATTPSVVALDDHGHWLVGQEAKSQAVLNPSNTVFSVKRFIGRNFSEPTVAEDARRMPYKLVPGQDDSVRIDIERGRDGKEVLGAEQISAKVLRRLKEDAEATLGTKLRRAVITVPAYFNAKQRAATLNAATIAGFTGEVRLISEPTAAALAYGRGQTRERETLLVFDLGGGTLDVTILRRIGERYMSQTITGDTHLGGDDFDAAILDWLKRELRQSTGQAVEGNPQALQRLRDAAEAAKIELSGTRSETTINLPFLVVGQSGQPINLTAKLGRARLEEMTEGLIRRCRECGKRALADAGMTTDQIDTILLVGGQTRMPAVARAVEELFGRAPSRAVNPDQAVALGAAILGHCLATGGAHPEDESPRADASQPPAVPRPVPGGLQIVEVTSQPLGVRLYNDRFSEIVPKGATLPATRTRDCYTTIEPFQTEVPIEVYQGEGEMCAANTKIGQVILRNIPRLPAGQPEISIAFTINMDNTLRVRATETKGGSEVEAVLRYAGGMSAADLKRATERERAS
jgi:molecular chaperone DnaK